MDIITHSLEIVNTLKGIYGATVPQASLREGGGTAQAVTEGARGSARSC